MDKIRSMYPHLSFQKDWQIDDDARFMLGQCQVITKIISNIPLDPKYRKHLLKVSLRKGARATTAIEGNTLSEEEVAKIDEGGSLAPSKEYLEIEVKNVIQALNQVRDEVVIEGRAVILTIDLIKRFHHCIGKDLGDHFKSAPGQFRSSGHDVAVGPYKPPPGKYVTDLMVKFCDWMRQDFHFEEGKQEFADQVVQAVVTHIYIAWIHPFGDGNGRTARLLEFYILLRAGLPDIASHILSNFYNNTREEYYRQLDKAGKERCLSDFIKYAVMGFRDGLNEVLEVLQRNVIETTWRRYIYEMLDSKKATGKTKAIVKRRRNIALHFPTDNYYEISTLLNENPRFIKEYATVSPTTIKRDLTELENLELIVRKDNKYKGNIEILQGFMPLKKI